MIIPYDAISPEALDNLIKDYCLRDWGLNETNDPLSERASAVKRALETKQLVIVYSEYEESAYIKPVSELNMDTDAHADQSCE